MSKYTLSIYEVLLYKDVRLEKIACGVDDGDGNKDVIKAIGLLRKNNTFARASRFFVHFFAVLARLRRENA